MATTKTKFVDSAGNEFDTEAEADASSAVISNQELVNEFIAAHFNRQTVNGRRSPAATAARNVLNSWHRWQQPVQIEA